MVMSGLAVCALASLATLFVHGFAALLVCRFFEGLGFMTVAVSCPALVTAASDATQRRFAIGLWSSYMPAGAGLDHGRRALDAAANRLARPVDVDLGRPARCDGAAVVAAPPLRSHEADAPADRRLLLRAGAPGLVTTAAVAAVARIRHVGDAALRADHLDAELAGRATRHGRRPDRPAHRHDADGLRARQPDRRLAGAAWRAARPDDRGRPGHGRVCWPGATRPSRSATAAATRWPWRCPSSAA